MRKCLFLLAASALCAAPTLAADLPSQPARAPAVLAPSFNWSGFYVGAMGGYAFGAGGNDGLSGGFFGGTVGANYQPAGSWVVFGIEGDAAWSNFGRSESVTAGGVAVTAETETDFIATIRGRFGAAFDRTLVYATAGGALARNTISVTAAGGGIAVGLSDSQLHTGYAVGAGVEHAFAGAWSVKAEYLYLGLGSKNYFSSLGGIASGDVDVHTIKAGLNYRFGG